MSEDGKTRVLADGVVQVFLPLPFKPTIVNVYLVRAGDTWTLVDTGMHTGRARERMDELVGILGLAARRGYNDVEQRRTDTARAAGHHDSSFLIGPVCGHGRLPRCNILVQLGSQVSGVPARTTP